MNEKFFFTRTVYYGDDGFSREAGKLYDAALYFVAWSFGSIGCNGYINTRPEVMDDLSQRGNTLFLVRTSHGAELEKMNNSGNQFTIAVAADEDFPPSLLFRKGHHEEPSMPEADDEIGPLCPGIPDGSLVDVLDTEGHPEKRKKEGNNRWENVQHNEVSYFLRHDFFSLF
jgi:hypothetical protein